MKRMFGWAAMAAGLVLAACGGGSDDGAKEALQGYLEDMKNQDYAAVIEGTKFNKEMTAEDKQQLVALIEEKAKDVSDQKSAIKEYTVTGDSVLVPDSLSIVFFDVTYENGEKESDNQKMVKVDGKWMLHSGK